MEAFILEVTTQLGGGQSMVSQYNVSAENVHTAQVSLKAQLDLTQADGIRFVRALTEVEIQEIGLADGDMRLVE